jgi:hypothetical protein
MTSLPGLFSFLHRAQKTLAENLKYGDVNLQIANPQNIYPLKKFSLCEFPYDQNHSFQAILDLPFVEKEAYVLNRKLGTIYYVNKSTNFIVPVYRLLGPSSLLDVFYCKDLADASIKFPCLIFDFFSKISMGNNSAVSFSDRGLYFFNKMFKHEAPPFYIEYITNISGCTLLHHAVFLNAIKHIPELLINGASLDLKARYKISPSGEILNLTPMELATLLERTEVIAMFNAQQCDESNVGQQDKHLASMPSIFSRALAFLSGPKEREYPSSVTDSPGVGDDPQDGPT